MSYLTRAIGAAKLAAKAHGPTIMVATGVVAMGASVITASRTTLRVEDELRPHVEKLDELQTLVESGTLTKQESLKPRSRAVGQAWVKLTKLYAVPGVLFLGGAGLVFGGHRVMVKRNATLAIAFTGVQKAFEAYRSAVRDEFGHEADQAMLHGYVTKEVIDPETGKTAVVNQRDWDAAGVDPYNRVFSRENSSQWIDDLSVNKMFIANQQRMAQILLGNRGYLYLSEVYESLGFPETDVSRVVGWKSKFNPDGSRDIPVVDFGLDKALPDDWKYSREKSIYLDFNCQGLIVGGKVQKALEKA